MRHLLSILSVVIFVWIGSNQTECNDVVQKNERIQINTANNQDVRHAIFLDNNLSGTQDSDEPDNVESVSILPETFYDFQQFVIKRISDDSSTIKVNLYCELLLDLPPPVFSI